MSYLLKWILEGLYGVISYKVIINPRKGFSQCCVEEMWKLSSGGKLLYPARL